MRALVRLGVDWRDGRPYMQQSVVVRKTASIPNHVCCAEESGRVAHWAAVVYCIHSATDWRSIT